VADLNNRVRTAQENITLIQAILLSSSPDIQASSLPLIQAIHLSSSPEIQAETLKWEQAPLILRSGPAGLLGLVDRASCRFLLTPHLRRPPPRETRYAEIREASGKIRAILDENSRLFQVEANGSQAPWDAYLAYLDSMVEDGLLRAVAVSLGYLLDETDAKKDVAALFTASLELAEPEIIYRPSLDVKMTNNFYDIVTSIIDDIFSMAGLVPRVAGGEGREKDYLGSAQREVEISGMKQELMTRCPGPCSSDFFSPLLALF
jgi:hypothetical protein